MARQEELEIALRDSITPGLQNIARELKALADAARQTAAGTTAEVDKMTASMRQLGTATQRTLRELQSMFENIIEWGKAILGVGGAYEAITRLTESLQQLAESRVQLSMFSYDTKLTAETIEAMRKNMHGMGIELTQANTHISTFATSVRELGSLREGAKLFQAFERIPGGAAVARQIMNEKDVEKQMQMVVDVFKRVGPELQLYIAAAVGVPESVLESWENYRKYIGQVFSVPPEIAKKYNDELHKMRTKSDTEWNLFGSHAMAAINVWFDRLNALSGEDGHGVSKFFIAGFDELNKRLTQDYEDVTKFYNLLKEISNWAIEMIERWYKFLGVEPKEQKEGTAKEIDRTREPDKAASFNLMEELRLQRENNKLLEDIKNTIRGDETGAAGGGPPAVGEPGGPPTFRRGIGPGRGVAPRPPAGPRNIDTDIGQPAPRGPRRGAWWTPEREQYAVNYLMEKGGLPEVSARALVARWSAVESTGGGPSAINPFSKAAGIAQWLGARKHGFKLGDINSQLDKVIREVHGREPGEGPQSGRLLMGARTELEAAKASTAYERAERFNWRTLTDVGTAATYRHMQRMQKGTGKIGGDSRDQGTSEDNRQITVRPRAGLEVPGRGRETYDKWRRAVDQDSAKSKSAIMEKGSASVTVDFGDMKERVKESKPDGGVFKPLNNEREPQAPKAGGNRDAYRDRWHYQ